MWRDLLLLVTNEEEWEDREPIEPGERPLSRPKSGTWGPPRYLWRVCAGGEARSCSVLSHKMGVVRAPWKAKASRRALPSKTALFLS